MGLLYVLSVLLVYVILLLSSRREGERIYKGTENSSCEAVPIGNGPGNYCQV